MQKLSQQEIQQKLNTVAGWKQTDDAIEKKWEFGDFKEAMKFINQVADLADSHDHHPELFNVYNKVSLKFSTHDAGGLTDKDFQIASEIDDL
jgi:4a-hydroxytetrahydrobiopterin dehydratase